jgi:hypothetical protein
MVRLVDSFSAMPLMRVGGWRIVAAAHGCKSREPHDPLVGVDSAGRKLPPRSSPARGALGEIFQAPTLADQPREATLASIDRVHRSCHGLESFRGIIAGIGVGSTGPLDPDSGTILEAETLPALFHFLWRRRWKIGSALPSASRTTRTHSPLAEATHGAGRGHSIVMGITWGPAAAAVW